MSSGQPEDPLLRIEDREISVHEREQVLPQIESAIADSRGEAGADLLSLPARRRGLLFPLLITLGGGRYLSAEGALIETLKEESENKLKAKEAEIADILKQVEQEAEKQRLRELRARVQEDKLLEDQIRALYSSVRSNLERGRRPRLCATPCIGP